MATPCTSGCASTIRVICTMRRVTALGDDLEYRTPENSGAHLNEKEIRFKAQEVSGANLHVNLHGYPSHEWTRPLSGYVPRNFAMWTLPKGFFLIIRHHADWESQAEALLDKVTRHLGAIPACSTTTTARSNCMKSTPAKPVSASSTAFRACRPWTTATPCR